MPVPVPSPVIVREHWGEIISNMRYLADMHVMVGVPSTRTQRKDGGPITNAALARIHENGAPSQNIPPRPFLKPGIKDAIDTINKRLQSAAKAAVMGDQHQMMVQLEAAGLAGMNAVQRKITDGPFEQLKEATIRARFRKTQSGRRLLKKLTKQGVNPVTWGEKNMKPLIDTGDLRRSITYVIRRRNNDVGGKP